MAGRKHVNQDPLAPDPVPLSKTLEAGRERVERSREVLSWIDRLLGKKDEKSEKQPPH